MHLDFFGKSVFQFYTTALERGPNWFFRSQNKPFSLFSSEGGLKGEGGRTGGCPPV